ncbi:MFS transporter [Curtobacterium sp. VKM Ac-2889]|uniref:MFS transporter n=1 Tax=Curtobacterium TaxID=2034 RepID=UPI0005AC5826|nr:MULTISPECIES: MFS transporter [Curtobacterium]KIQ10776.1 MFS transporter [Curtobacterium flaccumfaciens]MBF4598079.1 MFS transporter [Curtobacterium sp. VKM Ac-1796]MBF4610175.1 MFS transporter [Curtobacterium sp. VKM Ac-2889]MBT1620152.1 MFS transporter [Curtobacterium flaccumfaciens pv. poinsettiae]MDQ0537618.1 CP family cyanate transporter-like MFS transporter [Curtobacterium flaccumfaciens]
MNDVARRGLRGAAWLLPAAIVLIALNFRGPIVATAPVIGDVRADLGLTATIAGLLTTIPVLCFALATPFASWVIAKADPERAVSLSLVIVLAGTVVRSMPSSAALLIGTAVIGIGITIGNVVIPVVIRRDTSPERVGLVTGVYTSALNVGSMITSLGTAPLAALWGWPVAIAIWAVFALIAAAAWTYAVGARAAWRRPVPSDHDGPLPITGPIDQVLDTGAIRTARAAEAARVAAAEPIRPARRLITWGLTLAFGGQAFSYYALTAWIPTLLHDEIGFSKASSGASSSVFQILAVVGALGVPLLATRWRPAAIIALVGTLWLAMPLGLLFAPQLWLLWSVLGGAAQGGGITVIFIVIVRIVSSDADARRMSAFVQGGGYLIGSAGPLLAGALHGATGTWTAPLLVVLVAVLTLGVVGTFAARRVS